mgnify:CR=1 FL=1
MPRASVNREVFLEIAIRVLQVSSANCEPTEGLRRDPVLRVMRRSLGLARGVLAGHIDGATLPALVEGLLRHLLWEELRLEDSMAVEETARRILRGA